MKVGGADAFLSKTGGADAFLSKTSGIVAFVRERARDHVLARRLAVTGLTCR